MNLIMQLRMTLYISNTNATLSFLIAIRTYEVLLSLYVNY